MIIYSDWYQRHLDLERNSDQDQYGDARTLLFGGIHAAG
jgi:hypothetical protein